MQHIFKMYDETTLLNNLIASSLSLIKQTDQLKPIKKLIEILDILTLNEELFQNFKKSELSFDEIWIDVPTIKYLNHLRCALMVYHHTEFQSPQSLLEYNREFCRFLNIVKLRIKNEYDVDLPKIS